MANKSVSEKKKNPGASGNSWSESIRKFRKLAQNYAGTLPYGGFYSAFTRAGWNMANQPQVQNQRVKAISSLPVDYNKDEIAEILRGPYAHEKPLRETSEILRWTAYPYFKITKTYADLPSYKYYAKPRYLTAEAAKTQEFEREAVLVDKLNKTMNPAKIAHKIVGQAVTEGKVFYYPRIGVDKAHNTVNYAFAQQLPQDWCTIIGGNNVSGWTVSFNMMYFLTPGADPRQYGDLFRPYLRDFEAIFERPKNKNYIYASEQTVNCKGKRIPIYADNINAEGEGNPRIYRQDGEWMYWVSLPVDKVWVFEIDDTNPAVISPLSGLMLTYAQQSDYEAAQLSLILNPLIKIFTGEIPYFTDNGSKKDDDYRLSDGGRMMFEAFFNDLMAMTNTGGAAFFSAPVENIKSHDYAESANANDISKSFNLYASSKAGLSALIPADDDIKAGQVNSAQYLEPAYVKPVLRQFEAMMDYIYSTLNLRYEWGFSFIGDIFHESELRDAAEREIARGDLFGYIVIAALDGESWIDRLSSLRMIKESGLVDLLTVPETAYTQSAKSSSNPTATGGSGGNNGGGRPKTKTISESKEKSIDAGYSEE